MFVCLMVPADAALPDCISDACPVAFGNWKETYTIVRRKAVTLIVDNVTGWCPIYRWEARVGGMPTCVNASRLMRIR